IFMSPMLKWGLIVFVTAIVILIWDVRIASKKKEGITKGDKQRFWGIFWFGVFGGAGVAFMIWFAQDL
ncbi:MAG: hypothetical protein ACKVQK_07940, partial [Burkholderiales bacterium]